MRGRGAAEAHPHEGAAGLERGPVERLGDAARVDGAPLAFTLAAGRLAFLFVGSGSILVNSERLAAGDGVRIAGPLALDLEGSGEVVLWDVPPLR